MDNALTLPRSITLAIDWLNRVGVLMASFLAAPGRAGLTDVMSNGAATAGPIRTGAATLYAYIGWGTGTALTGPGTAPTGNTTLATAATEARVIGTAARGTSTTPGYTNDQLTYTGVITADGTKTITEVAVFSGAGTGSPATGGTMYLYSDHGSVALVLNETISYTIRWITG